MTQMIDLSHVDRRAFAQDLDALRAELGDDARHAEVAGGVRVGLHERLEAPLGIQLVPVVALHGQLALGHLRGQVVGRQRMLESGHPRMHGTRPGARPVCGGWLALRWA